MQTQIREVQSLTTAELQRWSELVSRHPEYSSPYFRPELTQDVATVRDDVAVAVFRHGPAPDQIAGFFPHQRNKDTARPVGGNLSDAHGIIHDGSIACDWAEILKRCRLSAFRYHYLIAQQIPSANWQPDIESAAVMNLTDGFEAYRHKLASASVVSQTDRKARKLAREVGPLRFEWNVNDDEPMVLLMKWKSRQYRLSGIADVFSFAWTRSLLRQIRQHQQGDYRGLLSVLYAGDRPAAIHFGLRAGDVLHQWFPAYDPDLQSYSPGMIHLLEMARHSPENNIQRIDLGRVCHYKARVATDLVDVAAGSIDLRPLRRLLHRGYQQTYQWLRHSPFRSVARVPGRMLRQISERRQFE